MIDKRNRVMWAEAREFTREEKLKGKEFQEGFYLFGGINSANECLNDLWLIQPAHLSNKRFIHDKKYTYLDKDPEITLNIRRITKFSGMPPCPRSCFSMAHINVRKNGHQLLVVYGGRNDKIFENTGNVALNDICIFNVNTSTWESLAMFGQMPSSRWSHCMVPLQNSRQPNEGFIVFGGGNLKAYCHSQLYSFTLSNKKAGKTGIAEKHRQSTRPSMA